LNLIRKQSMDENSTAAEASAASDATLLRVISCGEDGFINFWTVEIKGRDNSQASQIGESLQAHYTVALGATQKLNSLHGLETFI